MVERGVRTTLRLSGVFPPAVTVDFDHPSSSFASSVFLVALAGAEDHSLAATWLDESRIDAILEPEMAGGVYSVVLTDPRGRTSSLTEGVKVVDAATDGGSEVGCGVGYLDLDGDGWGASDTADERCERGRVAKGGDCNDADALSNPGSKELCNRLDDDCDGLVDEAACPPDAGWTARTDTGGPSDDWATASSYASGAVSIAGKNDVRNRPGAGAFVAHFQQCPNGFRGSWASPDGRVMLGSGTGGHGNLALAGLELPVCVGSWWVPDQIVGLVGFAMADGGVTVAAASQHGMLLQMTPGMAPIDLAGELPGDVHLEDLHGVDPESLLAVGSAPAGRPVAIRWFDGGVREEPLPGTGAAHGVWVLSSTGAIAVGDDGLVAEARGGAWVRIDGLDGGTLRSVRAFGRARIYTVAEEGRVQRWNGQKWEVLVDLGPGAPLYDITGTSEEDLWVVGANGLVLHWPL